MSRWAFYLQTYCEPLTISFKSFLPNGLFQLLETRGVWHSGKPATTLGVLFGATSQKKFLLLSIF